MARKRRINDWMNYVLDWDSLLPQRTWITEGPSRQSFDFDPFLVEQSRVIEKVRVELGRGQKNSCWIWFIFPQLRDLGSSWTSIEFGITSRAEAEAYLAHPILGPRLIECVRLVNQINGSSIDQVMGWDVDSRKFRSCMTLFAMISVDQPIFAENLQKYFGGQADWLTIDLLEHPHPE